MKACNQCGKCCENYSDGGLSALASEIEYWESARPDIFKFVSNGNIWMDPHTGKQLKRCPWLRHVPNEKLRHVPNEKLRQAPNEKQYSCDIYHDRPDDCKHYPVNINQMLEDECEMLEVTDLNDIKRAQKSLDKLMIDSRPSSGV